MGGMFVSLCLACKKSSEREFFVPAGMHLGVKLLNDSASMGTAKNPLSCRTTLTYIKNNEYCMGPFDGSVEEG